MDSIFAYMLVQALATIVTRRALELNKNQLVAKASSRFLSGFNCAESVLLTLAEHHGIESTLIPKIATPFGGGIARSSSICGCVTGALMGIGMKHGRMKTADDRLKAYAMATDFMNAFEKRFGSIICYDLVGCDFRTPEGQKRFEELYESRCANFVKGAVEIVLELRERRVKERL
jgi:C_GCAxxG_C_C family probable redox protein